MAVESTSNHTDEGTLKTPIFDESANARARPVEPIQFGSEPIHQNRLNLWRARMSSVSGFLGNQTRALAVVVVIGLITGAAGGLLLVNASRGDRPQEVVDTLGTDPDSVLSTKETGNLDAFASELSAASQTQRPTIKRKARVRSRSNKPRAYRVAIIR